MNRSHACVGIVLLALAARPIGAAPAAPAAAAPTTLPAIAPPRAAAAVVDDFIAAVGANARFDAALRTALAAEWKNARADAAAAPFLAAALARLYPDARPLLDALRDSPAPAAIDAAAALATHADPYLAVAAALAAARAAADAARPLDADRLLSDLERRRPDWRDFTPVADQALFLRGYCALQALRYDEVTRLLSAFLRDCPNAPERMRQSARQILTELSRREPQRLGDVRDLMDFAERELRHGRTDQPVRDRQTEAITLLDKLIEEANQREQEQQQNAKNARSGKKSQSPNGGKPGSTHAQRSVLPRGAAPPEAELRKVGKARPGQSWGAMPPKEREALLQSLQREFPSQYRDLVEQYYRQVGTDGGQP